MVMTPKEKKAFVARMKKGKKDAKKNKKKGGVSSTRNGQGNLTKYDLREIIIDKVKQISDLDSLENIRDYVIELFDDETQEVLRRFKARQK